MYKNSNSSNKEEVQRVNTYFRNLPCLTSYLEKYNLDPLTALVWAFQKFNREQIQVWNSSDETYQGMSSQSTSDFFYRLVTSFQNLGLNCRKHPATFEKKTSGLLSPQDYEIFLNTLEEILEEK